MLQEKDVQAHVSSSTEDLIDLLAKEQMLIKELSTFLRETISKMEETKNNKKLTKSIISLEKYFIPSVIGSKSAKLTSYAVYENQVSHPLGAYRLLWRSTRLK